MAKYWAGIGAEINMSPIDLGDVIRGQGVTVNEHTLKISYGHGYVTTIKGDFDLNGKGYATGGTITRISFEDDDHYGTTITGIRLDLGAFIKDAKSQTNADDAALFAKMLGKGDQITGDSSDDAIKGFGGDDTIDGQYGEDVIDGGEGDDILEGGGDGDTLTGGLGSDTFLYASVYDSDEQGADTITDFSQAEGDKIDLSKLGFFDFAEDIRITAKSGYTLIEVDTSGGWIYPVMIRVTGAVAFTEADFIL